MCAGKGTRWNNYLGVPKHLIEINGETLIGRTTRLLKNNGVNNYIITTNDVRYKQYGLTRPQTHNDCEIDRFEEIEDKEICYLYGDVYYSDEAIKNIVNTSTNDILFFGKINVQMICMRKKAKEHHSFTLVYICIITIFSLCAS